MSRLDEFSVEGIVHVGPHAIEQARARWPGLADLSDVEIGAEIARRVRHAIETKQVFDRVPRDYGIHGGGKMPPGQRFIRIDANYGVIVSQDRYPDLSVITVLKRLGRRNW